MESRPGMHIQRAIISDQKISFMIVAVPKPIMADPNAAEQTVRFLQAPWTTLPLALVTRDAHGTPTAYYGPGDLAVRLLRVAPRAILWGELPLSEIPQTPNC